MIPYLFALVAGASSLTSCATVSPFMSYLPEDNIDRAMRVLKIDNERMLNTNLPDNYVSLKFDRARLQLFANYYATIKPISPVESDVLPNGNSNFVNHFDNYMRSVLKDADTNNDKVITHEEVSRLNKKLCGN